MSEKQENLEDKNIDKSAATTPSRMRWWQSNFFSKKDYLAFWISFLISFAVYFMTTAPSVTLEDSGEFAVAGDYLGVPHPPGYPLWTMCAFVFTRIFRFVTYMGQPNPAWAIALMSGFFGALAAGITAMLINKCSKELILHAFEGSKADNDKRINAVLSLTCLVAAISGSLAFAFSPVEWSQSTIIEVYTLNSFFLMLIFLFIFKWLCKPSVKILWLVAFLFGLGFTNYQVLLFMAVPMIIAVLLHSIPLFRDFVLLFIPIGLTIKYMQLGAQFPQPGFAKLYSVPAQAKANPVDIVGGNIDALTSYYTCAILAGVLLCICALLIYLTEKNRNEKRFSFFADNLTYIKIVFGILAIVLFVISASVPAIKSTMDLSLVPKSEWFSFTGTYLLFALGIAILIGFGACFKGGLWYSVAMSVIQLSLLIFIRKGCMLGLTHPLSGFFAFYIALNILYLLMAWFMLPNGRAVAGTVLCAELGAAFYAYMPLASDSNPPMNWGFPKTWEGFKHAVSRGQYEKIVPITLSQVLSLNFVRQLGSYFTDLRMQFTLILAPLGFIPFALWSVKVKGKQFSVFPVAFGLAAAIAILAALDKLIDPTSVNDVGGAYKFLMGIILILATVGVALMFCRILHLLFSEMLDAAKELGVRVIAGLCFLGVAAGVVASIICVSNICAEFVLESGFDMIEPVIGTASASDVSTYFRWSIFLTIVISSILITLFALLQFLSQRQNSLIKTNHNDVSCKWFIITLIAFLMMSVVLIGMANPKGDIQDNFIQKVKFISSHAIFAIWIGYGIAMSIYLFRKQKWLVVPAIIVSALLFVIPIRENYVNADMVDITSAAEQNGHDFGWQFGNYQLRGAEAILEELSPDEEPLPNPDYPQEMTPDAIFFGGTDPGRFVPTYMIYSAQVRPDVFLITQNALADPTYLDTMRSLYSDQIWMPTSVDNNRAFQEYVTLVKSGKLPNLGGITETPRGVQVTGALEVMEINALITKQIFDKNIAKHDFYVEESYAMRWMNPYLTPHGLIMKLNEKPLSISEFNKTIQFDMDFWDWYTRKLTSTTAYERDVAARRAFSKLRASIAGLYANRRMLQVAERAYIDGMLLYPYSPECTIRYMRELLYPYGRLEDSILYVEKLLYKDKNNVQAQSALEMLKSLHMAHAVVKELKEKNTRLIDEYNAANPSSKLNNVVYILSDEEMLLLANKASELGDVSLRFSVMRDYFSRSKLDYSVAGKMLQLLIGFYGVTPEEISLVKLLPNDFFDNVDIETIRMGADAYMRIGEYNKAMNCLGKVLSNDPNDWRSWSSYSLLLLQASKGKPDSALKFLEKAHQAARSNGQLREFNELVKSVPELYQLYSLLESLRSQKMNNFPAGLK